MFIYRKRTEYVSDLKKANNNGEQTMALQSIACIWCSQNNIKNTVNAFKSIYKTILLIILNY